MEKSNWIWSKNENNPVNYWIIFRKKIFIDNVFEKAYLRVSADSRYHAYINGTYLGEGPSRGFAKEYFYDEHNITYNLQPGDNQFVFFVTHFGIQTHHHQLGEPGFICELEIVNAEGVVTKIVSDETFKVSRHTGFLDDSIKTSCGRMHIEMYDAGKFNEEIFYSVFDDSSWDNAIIRYDYQNSFWGNLRKRNSPSYTYEPVYPQRILENNIVKSDGISVVFDFHNFFLTSEDMQIHRFMYPDWFYFSTIITAECDMKIDLVLAYSRLWCVYGKFYLNGKVYLEEMDNWKLDPRQEGPVTISIDLKKGRNLLAMNCSNESMGRHIPMYFKTFGKKLSFSSPINNEMASLCVSSSFDKSDPIEIENLHSEIFDILIQEDYEKIEKYLKENSHKYVSTNHPQIPSMYREFVRTIKSDNLNNMISGNKDFAEITPLGDDREIVIDFGMQVAGFVEFEVFAPEGTILDFYGLEYIDIKGKRQEVDGVCTGFRYVCKNGLQKYKSINWQGMRYLIVTVRNFTKSVYFKEVKILKGLQPLQREGDFRCSDYRLNKIWEISANTIEICCRDMLIADTCHEQSFWTGDFRNAALFYNYLYNDYSNVMHSIKVSFGSLINNKLIEASLPAVPQGIIPNWSLLFMLTNRELFAFSGDEAFFADQYNDFKQLMENTMSFCDETGMFVPPYNDLIDWAGIDLRAGAYNAISNALLYKNLIDMAWNARYLGDFDYEKICLYRAGKLKKSVNEKLWSSERNAFRDCTTLEGELSQSYSIQTNCIMIMCKCVDESKAIIIDEYFNKGFPEDFIKIGSPFTQFFYHQALIEREMYQETINDVIINWSKMTDAGATSCYETFPGWERDIITRSYSHAWSCAPCFVAGNIVLGVKPLEPGFISAEIKPFLGKLEWATGSVPVPGGRIDIDVRKSSDGKTKVIARVPGWIRIETSPDIEYEIIKY